MPPIAATEMSTTLQQSNQIKSNDSVTGLTKLCYMAKRANFDGYGFNLHSEKSKPGQYIGKIDANSPAEASGLKEGYRIIEVNGIPIGNETHKQVVQRIKAIAWEVRLLVAVSNNSNNDESSNKTTAKKENKTKDHENHNNCYEGKSAAKGVSSTTHNRRSTVIKSHDQTNNNGSSSAAATIAVTSSPLLLGKLDFSDDNSLKLPSTAAEMRAILQSKKKFDPKSSEVNMQKKYEIIQKL